MMWSFLHLLKRWVQAAVGGRRLGQMDRWLDPGHKPSPPTAQSSAQLRSFPLSLLWVCSLLFNHQEALQSHERL